VPIEVCSMCGQRFKVSTKDWKLTHHSSDKVDTLYCVKLWIEKRRSLYDPMELGATRIATTTSNHPIKTAGDFRSNLEFNFSLWLEQNGFDYLYENWVFPVHNGWYIPDFYILEHGCFIETKGLWAAGSKKKLTNIYSRYPSMSLLLLPWTLGKKL